MEVSISQRLPRFSFVQMPTASLLARKGKSSLLPVRVTCPGRVIRAVTYPGGMVGRISTVDTCIRKRLPVVAVGLAGVQAAALRRDLEAFRVGAGRKGRKRE